MVTRPVPHTKEFKETMGPAPKKTCSAITVLDSSAKPAHKRPVPRVKETTVLLQRRHAVQQLDWIDSSAKPAHKRPVSHAKEAMGPAPKKKRRTKTGLDSSAKTAHK